jgi:hypothetical protein
MERLVSSHRFRPGDDLLATTAADTLATPLPTSRGPAADTLATPAADMHVLECSCRDMHIEGGLLGGSWGQPA